MKNRLISVCILGLFFSSCINIHASNKLIDVNNHWAKKEINEFLEKSFIRGYEDNTFRPNNKITRAEFIKVVNNYFGFKEKSNPKFVDIRQDSWYYDDICKAVKAGYINGYEDNTFRPNNKITREEAVKIVVSIKNKKDDLYDKLTEFPDGNLVSDWAKPYIEGAIESYFIKGDNLGNLNPKSYITRAESVCVLNNVGEAEYELNSVIEDLQNFPRINLHLLSFTVKQGEKWDNNRIEASALDREFNPLEVRYEDNVDTNIPGFYTVKISATDNTGKTNTREVYVEVEDDHLRLNRSIYPQIIAHNVRLKKGEKFDYSMLKAEAFDKDDNDISSTITYKGKIDTNKKGRQPVYISSTDKNGLTSTLLMLIRVY